MEYSSKVVVVTGGTAGVGRATAREFARKGFSVGIIARGKKRLHDTEDELREMGVKAIGVSADVSDFDELEKATEVIEKRLGQIGIWVNNAMTTVFSPVNKMTAEEFKRVTDVTYLGFVFGTLVALKRMIRRNEGTIIQVGSAVSYRAIPLQSAYSACKFAIRGFTDALRVELLHDKSNIHLTMVQLPALNTPQFEWSKSKMPRKAQPVPPIYQPEVAARAIVWSAFHKRRELNVGLSSALTIVLNKLFPGFIDKKLANTGYKSQQTKELEDPEKPNNLFESAPGDFKAHGRFDNKSEGDSTQLWLTTHLGSYYVLWVLIGMVAVVGLFIYYVL